MKEIGKFELEPEESSAEMKARKQTIFDKLLTRFSDDQLRNIMWSCTCFPASDERMCEQLEEIYESQLGYFELLARAEKRMDEALAASRSK